MCFNVETSFYLPENYCTVCVEVTPEYQSSYLISTVSLIDKVKCDENEDEESLLTFKK